jgi:16S rRNA (cytosine1407-C5)-methyltransferase
MGRQSTLLANELSDSRRRRLAKVLDEHLPPDIRERVIVSGFDAAAAGGRMREHGRFAAILLDAPCSSERHVIAREKALAEWTPARPRFLAKRQWALLSAAFLLLESGGSLVYATCALSPEENDGAASRLLKKYRDAVLPDPPEFSEGEATRYGRIILPDRCGGMGPMYVARFRKA